jgi:hypothetical protein
MTDDKTKVGEPDRSRVAKDQDYEIGYLAHHHGISVTKARELIEQFGNDRTKLNAAAQAASKDKAQR